METQIEKQSDDSIAKHCSKKPCYDFRVSTELCELCRGELFNPVVKYVTFPNNENELHFEWLPPKESSKPTSKKANTPT